MKQLWVKKYSPSRFDEFIFANKQMRRSIEELLDTKNIPHLLFVGAPGTGKSLISHLLIQHNEIEPADVLTIDASMENGVDVVRDKIRNFVTTTGFGDIKIVLLEEADKASPSFQDTLRELMVRYSDDARFILTANYEHKITDAIKSRVQTYNFASLPAASATMRVCDILDAEEVEFDLDDAERLVNDHLPDMRKIINALQQNCVKGVLRYIKKTESSDFVQLFTAGDFEATRNFVMINIPPTEIINLYSQMFDNILVCEMLTTSEDIMDDAIILLAKYQYQHAFSADPIICISALFAELRNLTK